MTKSEQLAELIQWTEKGHELRKAFFALGPEYVKLHSMLEWSDIERERYLLLQRARNGIMVEWNKNDQEIGRRFSDLIDDAIPLLQTLYEGDAS